MHIAAPGTNILSTIPGERLRGVHGHVDGRAARDGRGGAAQSPGAGARLEGDQEPDPRRCRGRPVPRHRQAHHEQAPERARLARLYQLDGAFPPPADPRRPRYRGRAPDGPGGPAHQVRGAERQHHRHRRPRRPGRDPAGRRCGARSGGRRRHLFRTVDARRARRLHPHLPRRGRGDRPGPDRPLHRHAGAVRGSRDRRDRGAGRRSRESHDGVGASRWPCPDRERAGLGGAHHASNRQHPSREADPGGLARGGPQWPASLFPACLADRGRHDRRDRRRRASEETAIPPALGSSPRAQCGPNLLRPPRGPPQRRSHRCVRRPRIRRARRRRSR